MKVNKFLFDLGNVFFDWSPHHVFKKIILDDNKFNYFINEIAVSYTHLRAHET